MIELEHHRVLFAAIYARMGRKVVPHDIAQPLDIFLAACPEA